MKWNKDIWRPNKMVIIFVQLNKDEKTFTVISTGKNKELSSLEEVSYDSIEEIVKKFGNSSAYWVHVSGSGVLTRLVDRASGYKDDMIINGNKDDFMFSSFTDNERSAVSFVRRQSIEDVLQSLKVKKAHLVGVSCGPVPTFGLLDSNETYSGEFVMKKQNGKISSCVRNEQNSLQGTFRGNRVSDKQVIAAGIQVVIIQDLPGLEFCLNAEETKNAIEEYKQHRRFNILGVGAVTLILLIVLGNYFYVNHLNDNIAQLETDLSLSNDNLSLIDRLDQEKSRKEQLIDNSGFLGDKYISYYLDKIGQSVPPTIYLRTMDAFPLVEKLKEKRKVSVDSKRIEITGLTNSNVVLDDWIEKMNRFEWVQSIEVLNYTKTTESQAQFKLVMILQK